MRGTTAAIGTLTLALALGSWFEGTLDAEMSFDVEPAPPVVAAPDLGQEAEIPGTFQDVVLAVQEGRGGCVVSAVSTGKDDQRLDLLVEVWETSGSLMARMVPPPRKVTEQAIHMQVPAGRRIIRAVAFEGLSGRTGGGGFLSREFRVVRPGAANMVALAALRVPVGGGPRPRPSVPYGEDLTIEFAE